METNMTVYETIKATKALLSDEKFWTQGFFAKNADGEMCFIADDEACQWCLNGAVAKVANSNHSAVRTNRFLLRILDPKYSNVGGFNDHKDTEYTDIIAFLDEAILKCQQY